MESWCPEPWLVAAACSRPALSQRRDSGLAASIANRTERPCGLRLPAGPNGSGRGLDYAPQQLGGAWDSRV